MHRLSNALSMIFAKLGFCRTSSRSKPSFRGCYRKLQIEQCEDRRMLATFTVTKAYDGEVDSSGDAPGTLRQAISMLTTQII